MRREEKMTENKIGEALIGCAISVHSGLGPGLLENAYEACLCHELGKRDIPFRRQVALPVHYDGVQIDSGYRLDILLDERVVVEIKAVDKLINLHRAQLLTYLKLGNFKLGYLLNFNTLRMREGIVRQVNGLDD